MEAGSANASPETVEAFIMNTRYHTIHIPRSTPWLPPSLLRIPGEIRLTVRFSEPERKVFRRHRKIPVSRWAERYRVVTMSVLPGRWKNEITPYLAGIMDASYFPSVQTVIICKAPQVGGTESVLNCIGYAIDRDPGPVLCIYPDEITARENNQDRIQPMISHSPRLRGYMTGLSDDSSLLRISLQHMPIYMAWARSASRLANKPIRYLVFDETDKYPETAGKRETDPISLGEARTITYRHNCKIWKISTPTTESGNIWRALTTEAQAIFDFWVRYPACDREQKMIFKQIQWAHRSELGPHGLSKSNDYSRDLANRRGLWRARPKSDADTKADTDSMPPGEVLNEYLARYRPLKIGFHIPSWLSPFVSLSTIAAAFLRGLSDINKFKDFHNKQLAMPWKMTVVSKNTEQVLAACCDLPAQSVPEQAVALTCGIDRQKYGFWFVVRAWAANLTSWLIHYGFVATEQEMEAILYESAYPVGATGRTMRIWRAAPDTGGSEKYEDMTMTEEMYFWILKNRGRGGVALWGTKGSSRNLPGMLSLGPAILSTPSGKKLPEALRILSVDTDKAKDQYHYRLQLATKPETCDLPGAAFLHKDTGTDYVAQILAEETQVNDTGYEEWINIHQRPNHLLDCEVLAAACVEMEYPGGGLRLLAAAASRKDEQTKTGKRPDKKQKPGRW